LSVDYDPESRPFQRFNPPRRERERPEERVLKAAAKRRQYDLESGITFAPAISEKSVRIASALNTSARERLFAPRKTADMPPVDVDAECSFQPRIDPRSAALAAHLQRTELWDRLHPNADDKLIREEEMARRRADNELRGCTFRPSLSRNSSTERLTKRLSAAANVDAYFAQRRVTAQHRMRRMEPEPPSVEERPLPRQPKREPTGAHKGEEAFMARQNAGRQRRAEKVAATQLRSSMRSHSASRFDGRSTGFVSNFDKLQELRSRKVSTPVKHTARLNASQVFGDLQSSLRHELAGAHLG
jgi:hypothetical protein